MPTSTFHCHVCGSPELREVPGFSEIGRVTSDCKTWPAGGRFAICRSCGFPQTVVTDSWREEIARIYGSYSIYFQSGGVEQNVFAPPSGGPRPRSDVIVEALLAAMPLPTAGTLLDVGCGNGSFFRAFGRSRPSWSLDGLEWDDKSESTCRALPGFRRLHIGAMSQVRDRYEIISIIHCLEHVPNPLEMLGHAHRTLKPDGLLLIQVPDCLANPFYLTTADHCSHFSCSSLAALVEGAGFEVLLAVNSWVPKEISLVGRKHPHRARSDLRIDAGFGSRLEQYISWLAQTAIHARSIAKAQVGIFGTAIAGTWLHGELGSRARFFVDEDPNRVGKTYRGLPVLSPSQVPEGEIVYIGLPPTIAVSIRRRLAPKSNSWVIPPELN